MNVDRDGLSRTYMTLGQIDEAIGMHIDDAAKQGIDWRGALEDAHQGIIDAQDGIRQYLQYTEECAVCDGMIGDADRAEVVAKGDESDKHLIIHQSCFRTADHEIA